MKTHEVAGTETGLAADWIIWGGKGQRDQRPRTGSSGAEGLWKREVGRQRGERAQEMPSRGNTKRAAGCDVAAKQACQEGTSHTSGCKDRRRADRSKGVATDGMRGCASTVGGTMKTRTGVYGAE